MTALVTIPLAVAQAARLALSVAHGALLECSPCAAPDCQATQREWLDDARREVEKSSAALNAALATEPTANPCIGRGDSRCNYLAVCGSICNKCGQIHDGQRTEFVRAQPAEPAPQPVAKAWQDAHGEWGFRFLVKQSGPEVMLYAAPPQRPLAERIERLQDAIEGECEGLSVDDQHAKAILEYVDGIGDEE